MGDRQWAIIYEVNAQAQIAGAMHQTLQSQTIMDGEREQQAEQEQEQEQEQQQHKEAQRISITMPDNEEHLPWDPLALGQAPSLLVDRTRPFAQLHLGKTP